MNVQLCNVIQFIKSTEQQLSPLLSSMCTFTYKLMAHSLSVESYSHVDPTQIIRNLNLLPDDNPCVSKLGISASMALNGVPRPTARGSGCSALRIPAEDPRT